MLKIDIEYADIPRSQTILFEPGLCADWRREIERRMEAPSYLALADENFARIYRLPASGTVEDKWRYLWAAPGDGRKNLEQFGDLVDAALDLDLEPGSAVVAIGGGATGDLAGFLAASLLGGLNFVQVPTTLLSQVDSAIGGKCGLNTRRGKNMLGGARPPGLVMIDCVLLDSLPKREYRRGLSEIVKAAVLEGPGFFNDLRTSADLLANGSHGFLSGVVARCCRFKSGLIMRDVRGVGVRRLLSLGHTFGHVLETLTGYDGRVAHGEAIGIGVALACGFSAERGLMAGREAGEVLNLLERFGLPVRISQLGAEGPYPPDWGRLLAGGGATSALMCGVGGDRLCLTLPAAIGDCRVVENVPVEEVAHFLRRSAEAR